MESLQNILNCIYLDIKKLNNSLSDNNISIDNLENILLQIDKYDYDLNQLNNTINMINNLKNNIKLIYNNKILHLKNKVDLQDKNKLNYSYKYDYKIEIKNITNDENFKHKQFAKCPVIIISEEQLPYIMNSPIYFIKESNEYCIKINNKIIKGNIGNIYSKNEKNTKNIKKCNKLYCNNIFYNKKECSFYHDKNDIRNFPNYSWKHIKKDKIGKIKLKKNSLQYEKYDLENTRFLGSLDSLSEDLVFTNNKEKELRNKQLMHDLLIYQLLDQYLD